MKINPETDYSAYANIGHNSAQSLKAEIVELAQEQLKAERKIEKIEEDLKAAKEDLRIISEDKLPEAMDNLGIPEFTTADGIKIQIKETVRASISIERRPQATQWLEDNNYGGLLKTEVVTAFGRDELEAARKLETILRNQGMLTNLERTVHSSTLASFVREQLANGKDIPLDLFGVLRTRASKIKVK